MSTSLPIRFGLKLWSTNYGLLREACAAHAQGAFDFIELYASPAEPPDLDRLSVLREIPVTIHATHSHGFHEFVIGPEQLAIWERVVRLADFFESTVIVVHPGRDHTVETFQENLRLVDDPRIVLENMPGLDLAGRPVFGQRLEDLRRLRALKPICLDLEKAAKAACYQGIDYRTYIADCLRELQPTYFHISGGRSDSPMDEHLDLWDGDFDLAWMREQVRAVSGSVVFETPKRDGLANDLRNMAYFAEA